MRLIVASSPPSDEVQGVRVTKDDVLFGYRLEATAALAFKRKRRAYASPMAYEQSDDLNYEVVVSANEDVTGVHEVWWVANTWWPDLPLSVRLRRAEDAISWALERGLIALYYDANAEGRQLAPHEVQEALRT